MKREKIKGFLKLMRPKQWFKSLYVIFGAAPAIFLTPPDILLIVWLLFLCLVNLILLQGFIYTINDIIDVKEDRAHPKKKYRPIASNLISKREAFAFASILLMVSLVLAYLLGTIIFLLAISIIIINLLYTLPPIRLKSRFILDILSAGLNFPLRVTVGWFLFEPFNNSRLSISYDIIRTTIDSKSIQSIFFKTQPMIIEFTTNFSSVTLAYASMVLFTYFLAIFLLSLKRLAEIMSIRNAVKVRGVLEKYNTTSLKAIALFSFLLAIASSIVLAISLKLILIFLVPILIFGMAWYYRLTIKKPSLVRQPEEIFTKMRRFLLLGLVFIILTFILLFI